jgi:hypothetical protein
MATQLRMMPVNRYFMRCNSVYDKVKCLINLVISRFLAVGTARKYRWKKRKLVAFHDELAGKYPEPPWLPVLTIEQNQHRNHKCKMANNSGLPAGGHLLKRKRLLPRSNHLPDNRV